MGWEGLNRRKFPRAKFPCLIKILRSDGQDAILTHTENISIGGVCVIIKRQLDIFTTVGIEIDLMDGEELISCASKVVWIVRRKATEEVKPSHYDIGIEFVDLKPSDRARIEKTVDHLVKAGREVR
ncbi:MAG: PilZ domain-containing protein [Candidatus Omnitrophica bacterium]|nr:PilZ domain-containing protein [Candidatus Omnitrophota bacterium]